MNKCKKKKPKKKYMKKRKCDKLWSYKSFANSFSRNLIFFVIVHSIQVINLTCYLKLGQIS